MFSVHMSVFLWNWGWFVKRPDTFEGGGNSYVTALSEASNGIAEGLVDIINFNE